MAFPRKLLSMIIAVIHILAHSGAQLLYMSWGEVGLKEMPPVSNPEPNDILATVRKLCVPS